MFKGPKIDDNPLSFIVPARRHLKIKGHKRGSDMHLNGLCKTKQKP